MRSDNGTTTLFLAVLMVMLNLLISSCRRLLTILTSNERRLFHSAHSRRMAAPDFGHRRQWALMRLSPFKIHCRKAASGVSLPGSGRSSLSARCPEPTVKGNGSSHWCRMLRLREQSLDFQFQLSILSGRCAAIAPLRNSWLEDSVSPTQSSTQTVLKGRSTPSCCR